MGHLASKLRMKPPLDLLSGLLSSSLGKHAGKMSNISLSRFELYCNEVLVLREPKMFEDQRFWIVAVLFDWQCWWSDETHE